MTLPSRPPLPRTLPLLQIFRGVAAAFVVSFHVTWHGSALYHEYFVGRTFLFGHSGVDFFFVLSGFIMVYAHAADAGRAERAWPFVKARIARVFPAYWIVLALTLAAYAYRPGLGDYALNLATAARAVVLYDQLHHSVVPVAWSLSYELAFYVFFVLYFVAGPRLFAGAAVVWCGLVAAATLTAALPFAPTLLSPLICEFFLGCLAAMIVVSWRPRLGVGWLLAAGAVWVAVAAADSWEYVNPNANVRNFAVPYALLVLAAAGFDLGRRRRYPGALVLLGDASYSIYLVHYLALQSATLWLGGHRDLVAPLGRDVTLAIVAIALLAAGVLFHVVIERPLQATVRRVVDVRSRAPVAPGASRLPAHADAACATDGGA